MKSIYKKLLTIVFMSCLLGLSQSALSEMRDLTSDEITAMFSDKTAWGNHARKNRKNKVYFAPDGTFKGKRLDKTGGGKGKWYANDMNLMCIEKKGDTKCRRVVDKNGKIQKYKGDKHVWTYTKFKDGNQL